MPRLRRPLLRLAAPLTLALLAIGVHADAPAGGETMRGDVRSGIEALRRQGDVPAALQRVQRALVQQPGDAQLRFLHGVLLSDAGQAAQARTVFERLTEDFPELPEPHNNLAVLHAADGKWHLARQALERAVQHAPDYATAHENLGDVYLQLAALAYESASAQAPRPAALQRKLALVRELLRPPSPR